MSSLHFLLVEDQTIVRELMAADLMKRYPGSKITQAGSLAELNQLGAKGLSGLSLAIVDLELPDGNALDWAEAYAARPDSPKIVILSAIKEDFILFRALRSSIPGFVHKTDGRETLTLAIDAILSGHAFFSPTVQHLRKAMHADPAFFNKILTDKEQHVLRMIGEGLSNEEIAEVEGSKVSTIVDHRKNLMNKLGIHSATELMRYALTKGFARI